MINYLNINIVLSSLLALMIASCASPYSKSERYLQTQTRTDSKNYSMETKKPQIIKGTFSIFFEVGNNETTAKNLDLLERNLYKFNDLNALYARISVIDAQNRLSILEESIELGQMLLAYGIPESQIFIESESGKPGRLLNRPNIESNNPLIMVSIDKFSARPPPNCPNWNARQILSNDAEMANPNYSCSDAHNLALMIDKPRDLLHGRNPSTNLSMTLSEAVSIIRQNPVTGSRTLEGISGRSGIQQ